VAVEKSVCVGSPLETFSAIIGPPKAETTFRLLPAPEQDAARHKDKHDNEN